MKTQNIRQGLLLTVLIVLAWPVLAVEKSATLDWNQRLELSTPVSGVIADVLVKVGQRVKKNQALIKLDRRGFNAQLKKTKAILSRSQENYAEAKRELERAEELFERTAISVHDRQLVKIEYTKAQAELFEAEAGLTQAQLDLEYSVIRSPIGAMVVQVFVHDQQTVVNRFQASPLLVIADASLMLARTGVNVSELREVKVGTEVKVKVGSQVFTGKVSSIGMEPRDNEQGSLYLLEVAFNPEGKMFRKGQAATLILP